MNWIVLGISNDDGLQIQRLHQFGRSQHLRLRHRAAGGERHALPLADVQVLAAAAQFRATGRHRNFLLLGFRIAAHRGAAIGLQRRHGIFEGNFRLRSWHFPRAGRQVHLTGSDVHADGRGVILLDEIFFHGHQSIALHGVSGAVGEGDTRHSLWAGLHQVPFVQCQLIVGARPGD